MPLPPYPEFGWSWSRSRMYHHCPRKYWVKVYLSWLGWEAEQGSSSWLAYRLSKLVTYPLLVGTLVHDVLRELAVAARNGQELPPFDLVWRPVAERLRRVHATTRGEFLADPKRSPMLADAYYDSKSSRELAEDLRGALDAAAGCLANALELDLWDEVRSARRVRAPDEREGATVNVLGDPDPITWWGAPDLAFVPASQASIDLVDYKTGDSVDQAEASVQVHGYVAFLLVTGGKRWSGRWRGRIISLRDAGEVPIPITQTGVFEALALVESDVRAWRMRQTSVRPNVAPIAAFPPTEDRTKCSYCEYLELCRGKDSSSPAALPAE